MRARRASRSRATAASSSPASREEAVDARQSRRRQSTWCATTTGLPTACAAAGAIFVGSYTAQVAGDYAIGSNHVLPTSGAARFRGGLHARRFRARVDRSADDAQRADEPGADGDHARATGRARSARAVDRGRGCDDATLRPADRAGALRLHLNENTGGCSPAVIEAIRQISAEDVAYYPDYSALSRECADVSRRARGAARADQRPRRRAAGAHGQRVPRDARLADGLPEAIVPDAGVRDVLGVREGGRRARRADPAESRTSRFRRGRSATPSPIARGSSS